MSVGLGQVYSARPLDTSIHVHVVRFGRRGRDGWLHVDDHVTTSGHSAGILTSLNTDSDLYVGGVDDDVITFLPDGAKFNDGFHGKHKELWRIHSQTLSLVLSIVFSVVCTVYLCTEYNVIKQQFKVSQYAS